ncbi:TetR/AcrR family transcriptional regulator [Liquorilactobacillus capillatus]|uniref:TetR family transcriptional regulator n=2 Tax=Liquorilactobacillus capillatus TaxID=480931 RepID=A0A0R1LYY6_9LACO|nr:TetR/AcrR family transcriptional regulator [Liquorilactobacillus capillatus]AJA33846.1 TetR family transcriptional regulator [Liquorilactobacillus capillatus]KRL00798.1 TetR family transcriptional regulator [Liquorilactobacillus capillatus DSM 19910]
MNKTALKSKKKIMDVFFEKLATERIEVITISEIASEAGVSRKTFYRNYAGKLTIIKFYIQETVNKYLEDVSKENITSFQDVLTFYFSFWKSQSRYLETLQNNGLLSFMFDIQRETLLKKVPWQSFAWHTLHKDETIIDLLIIGGIWNIFLYNLNLNNAIEPEVLAQKVIDDLKVYIKYLN